MTDEEKFLCRCACRRCTKQDEEECKTCEYNYYDKEGEAEMRSKAGMKFDCIFEETLDFIDIDYTYLNKTIRYEQRPHAEWEYLKEHITEMRDADGEFNQKDTCQFILNLMGVIEREGEKE